MNLFFVLMISSLALDRGGDKFGTRIETSLRMLKFTPRWTIEPLAGHQFLLFTKTRFYYQFHPFRKWLLGMESGYTSLLHSTYFYSYQVGGLSDSYLWFVRKIPKDLSLIGEVTIPTGNYKHSLGTGAWGMEVALRKELPTWLDISLGYKWKGRNPDGVDYGDGVLVKIWTQNRGLCLTSGFYSSDRGHLFQLYDSPSFVLNLSLCKVLNLSPSYSLRLLIKQTLLGRDTEITSTLSIELVRRE